MSPLFRFIKKKYRDNLHHCPTEECMAAKFKQIVSHGDAELWNDFKNGDDYAF
jgi:hypothetical protein